MERSSFFNAELIGEAYDRVYLAEDYARYFASFIGNGVFPNPATGLQVTADSTSMNVIIKQGKAWIDGYFYENTDNYTLKVEVADGVLNRIDRIVLRLDFLNREIRSYVKKGVFASNPVAPTLQRDADMYEIALADVKITRGAIKITQADITDLRLNTNLCGIVHGTVDQVDTTAIFNQFQSWYSQTKTNYDNDIATWTQNKKDAFDSWYSQNTQAFLNQFNNWYSTNTTEWSNSFNAWFDTIKGQLDGDIAANLANKINELGGVGRTTETIKGNADAIVALTQSTNEQLAEKANLVDGKVPINELPPMDFIPTNQKGQANGIVPLNNLSKIDATYLSRGFEVLATNMSSSTLTVNNIDMDKFQYICIYATIGTYAGRWIKLNINGYDYPTLTNVNLNGGEIFISKENLLLWGVSDNFGFQKSISLNLTNLINITISEYQISANRGVIVVGYY